MKENKFREKTNDMFAYPRELDQAVTFLHDNGEWGVRRIECKLFNDLVDPNHVYVMARISCIRLIDLA